MNSTLKAGIAGLIGATFGYVAGHKLPGALSIVAALMGGAVGWVAYDPRGFFRNLREIASDFFESLNLEESNRARAAARALAKEKSRKNWKRFRRSGVSSLVWKESLGFFLLFQGIVSGEFLTLNMIILLSIKDISAENLRWTLIIEGSTYLGICIIAVTLVVSIWSITMREMNPRKYQGYLKQIRSKIKPRSFWRVFIATNLVTLPLTVCVAILYGAYKGILYIPKALKFLWFVFLGICGLSHDYGRLAAFGGGALGTLIGLYAHHIVISGLIGFVVGFLMKYIGDRVSDQYMMRLYSELFTPAPAVPKQK